MNVAGYTICKMVIGSPPRVSSDANEYVACRSAVDGLQHVCDVEEKYEGIIENYIEWETTISQFALREMVSWTIDDIEYQTKRKAIARKLLNLLASSRLYIDSLPKHTKAILSDNEPDLRQVEEMPSVQYDSSLSYRIMEALRNYAQHSALPIHGITTHSQWHREIEPHVMSFTIWPRIDLGLLAEDKTFKRSVLKEMSALEKIELKPMVREYIQCVSAIHSTFRNTTKKRSDEWIAQLQRSTRRFVQEFPEEKTLGLAVLPIDERGFSAGDPVYIDGPIESYLKHMQSNYRTMVNFAKRRVDF